MWCDKCQADVEATTALDNAHMVCPTCGSQLSRPAAGEALPAFGQAATVRALRDPRELLARWAREDALEPLDFMPPVAREPADANKPLLRFDGAHPILSPAASFVERAAALDPSPARPVTAETSPSGGANIAIHPAHGLKAPHFQKVPVSLADKSSKWVTLVGQLFAYFGVGGLTVGTVLILMGYFGGHGHYTTTGWLITTAGQMLLFLGVVTLVSGGMEQTTQEVARRIDTLGERLVRIEKATVRTSDNE